MGGILKKNHTESRRSYVSTRAFVVKTTSASNIINVNACILRLNRENKLLTVRHATMRMIGEMKSLWALVGITLGYLSLTDAFVPPQITSLGEVSFHRRAFCGTLAKDVAGKSCIPLKSSTSSSSNLSSRVCRARELIKSLVEEDKCFSTESGAMAFGEVCAINIVYEDCFEPQPVVGKLVRVTLLLVCVAF